MDFVCMNILFKNEAVLESKRFIEFKKTHKFASVLYRYLNSVNEFRVHDTCNAGIEPLVEHVYGLMIESRRTNLLFFLKTYICKVYQGCYMFLSHNECIVLHTINVSVNGNTT